MTRFLLGLTLYQHHYLDYYSDFSCLPGTLVWELKIGQEVRHPMVVMDNEVMIVTTFWASTSSSVMRFSEEQIRHVPCVESRAMGYGRDSMEQIISRFFPPFNFLSHFTLSSKDEMTGI